MDLIYHMKDMLLHSLLHIAVGACLAYLIGNKKSDSLAVRGLLLLFGGIAGLSPDFTKAFGDLYGHSLGLVPVFGLLFAWAYRRIRKDIPFPIAWLLFSAAVLSHLFIDTVGNGNALFYPFIEREYEFAILRKADDFSLAILLLSMIGGLLTRRGKRIVAAGALLVGVYLASLSYSKLALEHELASRYEEDGVEFVLTYPGEMRRGWEFMVRTKDAFITGHSSVLKVDPQIEDVNEF
ncbi:metal-dependent hydrolase [Cohnella sp. AR92]|uniref:metal-dependent hydrolase n=1 Tax=Cohnella sp. AR92 TaxID=648716 RepID=UPI000F8E4111|nr:metal-dependent hydrolase [Cohnella sp. AR92]RUS45109.1 metal-dependent hydrolase [Cohnella sp. AR92]